MKPTRLLLLLTAALAPGLLTAQTQVPARISYQGIVTDAGNALVGDPTPVNRTVIFRIWDNTTAAAQGNLVYAEEQVVTIAKGEFSVLVGAGAAVTGTPLGYSETAKGPGSVNIANAFNGSGRYLGVTVDDGTAAADTEVSPRQQIVTTAFAFRAQSAETVASGTDLQLNGSADYGLGWYGSGRLFNGISVNGPVLYGAGGGALGSSIGTTKNIALQWNSSGNVGIGTSTPGANAPGNKLDINGNVRAFGVNPNIALGDNTQTTRAEIALATTGGAFNTYAGVNDLVIRALSGRLMLQSGPGSSPPAIAISTDNYVGIGTAAPTQALDVAGNIKSSGTVIATTVNTGNVHAGAYTGARVTAQGDVRNTGVLVKGGQPGIQFENTDGGNGWNLWAEDQGDLYFLKLGANPNYTMTLAATGNVGIGTQSPATKLHVIKPGGAWPATSGNTQSAGHLMRMEDGSNAVLDFGSFGGNGHWLQSTDRSAFNLNYPLLLNPNGGNVGIGTTSPATTLDVRSATPVITVGTSGGSEGALYFGNSSHGVKRNFGGLNDVGLYTAGGDLYLSSAGISTSQFVLKNSGNVGIGTATPGVKLDVVGTTDIVMNAVNFAADPGKEVALYYPRPVVDTPPYGYFGAAYTGNVSIRANGWIASAYGFIAYSDQRIKKDIQASPTSKDLAGILQLKVTDYRMVDYAEGGSEWRKGFIAQEVEKVIPGAVTRNVEFVPDIFSLATAVVYEPAAKTLALTLAKDHGLKAGDRVRLHMDGKRVDLNVSTVPSARDFVVEKCESAPEKVFVYGRQVSDFRTVNYDRIFTTGIGAIQELKKEKDAEVADLKNQIAARDEKIATLEKSVAALESKDRARDARLAAIEQRLSAAAPAAETVSLKTAPGVE